ncbi:MAG: hypothetical protein AB1717_06120 [Pseudomonadota bacterium]
MIDVTRVLVAATLSLGLAMGAAVASEEKSSDEGTTVSKPADDQGKGGSSAE